MLQIDASIFILCIVISMFVLFTAIAVSGPRKKEKNLGDFYFVGGKQDSPLSALCEIREILLNTPTQSQVELSRKLADRHDAALNRIRQIIKRAF